VAFVEFLHRFDDSLCKNHSLFHEQLKSLLAIDGCFDFDHIGFHHFSLFCSLTRINDVQNEEILFLKHGENSINFEEFSLYMIQKPSIFISILENEFLVNFFQKIVEREDFLLNLFFDFRNSYIKFRKEISFYPSTLQSKIENYLAETDISIFTANLLYFYRISLLKIEILNMEEMKTIPISSELKSENIPQLLDYFKRTESVSLIFLKIT
jgi:hypothetical protein